MGSRAGRAAVAALACALTAGAITDGALASRKAPTRAPTALADPFDQSTTGRRASQIELATISTLPDAVSGGDVLMELRGLRAGDRVAVRRDGRSVTAAFGPLRADGTRRGLVTGLRDGLNRITAVVRRGKRARKVATLGVRNHPVTGPILSGPHQTPFFCESEQSGLGKPLDEYCSIEPRVEWYARRLDNTYEKLADPYAPYPRGTIRTRTRGGREVPFVVRVETRTINRGLTRLAVLDDPHARGKDAPLRTNWNKRLTYSFGESCGVGYRQGRAPLGLVLGVSPAEAAGDTAFALVGGVPDRLAAGDLIAYSSQTAFGVYCNPLTSLETLAMVKEHIVETLGDPESTLSVGGSGGALQQYNAVNNGPGLLDAAMPIASFTDVVSTAMTVVDCGLLLRYQRETELPWTDDQILAVRGHRTLQICRDWEDLFLPVLHPFDGCSGIVPKAIRYDAQRNPTGVRCTLQDATKNLWPTDPATGFADRPYDNVGVQYGLNAFNAGLITAEQFVDLNVRVGGFDLDARPTPQRSAMLPQTAEVAYRLGGVIGRGAIDRAPIIDLATYLDLVPVLGFHDHVRPYMVRDRLRRRSGGGSTRGGNLRIWRGVSLPGDAYPAMDRWIDAIRDRDGLGDPEAIVAARPAAADDRCIVGAGTNLSVPGALTAPLGVVLPVGTGLGLGPDALADVSVSLQLPEAVETTSSGACAKVFPALTEPRIVAGGPLSDDIVKCTLKPLDPQDYRRPLTAAQVAALRTAFPQGVCDWSKPGVGEVPRSILYPSVGGTRLAEPRGLRWRVARSR